MAPKWLPNGPTKLLLTSSQMASKWLPKLLPNSFRLPSEWLPNGSQMAPPDHDQSGRGPTTTRSTWSCNHDHATAKVVVDPRPDHDQSGRGPTTRRLPKWSWTHDQTALKVHPGADAPASEPARARAAPLGAWKLYFDMIWMHFEAHGQHILVHRAHLGSRFFHPPGHDLDGFLTSGGGTYIHHHSDVIIYKVPNWLLNYSN
jgi:hypothetical protein